MKLNPNVSIPDFLTAVQECSRDVWFTTPEGDRLNLRSALSQFVFAGVVAGNLENLAGEVLMENPADLPKIRQFLME